MREVVLTIPRLAVEDVLDRLLPIVPGGVRERPAGRHLELRMRGPEVPELAEIERAVGRWPHRLAEHEVADDWRERRLAEYEADAIGGRLVLRPDWAPEPRPGVIDIVLSDSAAFGGGTHPTTRTCLELLLDLPPLGSFADLGCGTGVLAILAARLGWKPVVAMDLQPAAVQAARTNANLNEVEIEVSVADLSEQPPPAADGFAANVPAALHPIIAAAWRDRAPGAGLISGFDPSEAAGVLGAYAACGLRERRRLETGGWVVAELDPG